LEQGDSMPISISQLFLTNVVNVFHTFILG
jgi:hypothetical protein